MRAPRPTAPRWTAALAALAWAASACDRAPEEPAPAAEPPAIARAEDAPPAPPGGAPGPGERVVFDLVAHAVRGEATRGGVRVVDLGTPAGAGLTLGGWRTGVGDDATHDGVSVSVVPGVTARLFLGVEEGDRRLALRLAAPGDPRVTVYLDGEAIGHAELPAGGGLGTVELALPEGLAPGDHVLQLRVPRRGVASGVGQAGLLLDALGVGPGAPGDGALDLAPPVAVDGGALRLVDGGGVRFTLDPPPGARLRGEITGAGRLVVRAVPEGDAPRELGTVAAGPVDLELAAAGADPPVLRLALEARGGPVQLRDARIVVAGPPPPTAPRPAPARNLVVVLCDTLRADALRAYDPTSRVRTPALARLADGAATFLGARAQENWTKPSVATLLTGLFPWQHGAQDGDSVVPASAQLLSERLRDAGFHTGAFIANGYVSGKFGFERGWRTWRNYIREGRRTPARFVARDVLAWLDDRPADDRFFLYVHTIDPHVPYIVPDALLASYDADPYSGPVDFQRDRRILEAIKVGRLTLDARDRRRLRALYDAEISYHDTHFATVLEALERRGLADDTIVVFTSDHGEEFFDHGSVGHGHSVWEELLAVPLLVRIPGLTDGGARLGGSVGLVDVAPTVLDALGLEVPPDMPGRSLLPRLRGVPDTAPTAVVSAFMGGWRTVVVGDHKLVQRSTRPAQLYDLGADPGETRDLAADRPITVRWLRTMLGLALDGDLDGGRGAPRLAPERTEIDDVTAAQLEALGYGRGFRAGAAGDPDADDDAAAPEAPR